MSKDIFAATAEAVRKWCKAQGITQVTDIRHVHPRAYVIGYAAPLCLVVSRPWVDSEPQCREFDKSSPLCTIITFDRSLVTTDWCSTAYVCHGGVQETIAIPVVPYQK